MQYHFSVSLICLALLITIFTAPAIALPSAPATAPEAATALAKRLAEMQAREEQVDEKWQNSSPEERTRYCQQHKHRCERIAGRNGGRVPPVCEAAIKRCMEPTGGTSNAE